MNVDLHGYRSKTICQDFLRKILKQAWETGEQELIIIHGHGLSRGNPRPCANTNTGDLGLAVRGLLRNDRQLRAWMYALIDVKHPGCTVVRLRPNSDPIRKNIDPEIFPQEDFRR